MAHVISGKELALLMEQNLAERVAQSSAQKGRKPGLGVILVGDNPASKVYVANKEKAAHRVGFSSFDKRLPADTSETELFAALDEFNNTEAVDGILLQLPLPKHLNSDVMISHIQPSKDAAGLHPYHQGLVMRGDGKLIPCTPAGSLALIDVAFEVIAGKPMSASSPKKDLAGLNAVVVGRSILVGKPISLLLQQRNATVTMAHSKTKNLKEVCMQADILVAAVGVKELIKGDFVKPGAIVIDVGINRGDDGKLYGDVDFAECSKNAAAITPVPGGVGPMTIQMLLENTFQSFKGKL